MKNTRFIETLKTRILVMDGAMGTLLQERGLRIGQAPEELNITAPDVVKSVHEDYFSAGSDVVLTNTFGATRKKLAEFDLEHKIFEINQQAALLARETADPFEGFVAGDIGPLGSYLSPLGPLSWDEAYALFSEQVKALASAEPDLLIIETMTDIRELKAALRAAKDFFPGPVFAQMTFTEDTVTVTGTDPLSFVTVAEAMGADGIGVNCSVGPKDLYPVVEIITAQTHLPVSVKPNRGMPTLLNRQTIYPGTIEEFITYAKKYFQCGINMIGGCCGTDPGFIEAIAEEARRHRPAKRLKKTGITRFSSRTRTVTASDTSPVVVIGERINPTGRKTLQQELTHFDFTMVRNDALAQEKAGAHMLDVNMGLAGGDEPTLMAKAMEAVQSAAHLPLTIDSSSPETLETALKLCEGKPLVNSISGEEVTLKKILPLIKRYGAGFIALPINEKGIPKNSAERLKIAKKIISAAQKHGIPSEDIVIDCLSLAVSTEQHQARETLKTIRYIAATMKLRTVLGISNISFGMPNRPALNSTFLNLAKEQGLSFAIINPLVPWTENDPYALNVFKGKDPRASAYIKRYAPSATSSTHPPSSARVLKITPPSLERHASSSATIEDLKGIRLRLNRAILDGIQESIYAPIDLALQNGIPPQEITSHILLPALEEVGEKFVRKIYFLPQVLMCAETMQKAFLYIQSKFPHEKVEARGTLLLATVQGDVHDIGKNIVKSVFVNHGWKVIDLGKNIPSTVIIEQAKKTQPDIIGLSALMTTTMVFMEDVIKRKHREGLAAPVIIGGAAVTKKYADQIKADGFASDAVQGVKIAEHLVQKSSTRKTDSKQK